MSHTHPAGPESPNFHLIVGYGIAPASEGPFFDHVTIRPRQRNMSAPCHHRTPHTFRLKNNDTRIAEHTACPPYKGQCTPSSFLSHLADGQSTTPAATLGPRTRSCALDTTFVSIFSSLSYHLRSFVVYLSLLLYKNLSPGLTGGPVN